MSDRYRTGTGFSPNALRTTYTLTTCLVQFVF